MEKQLIFAIYDMKAEAYMQPWFLPSEGLAIRAFSDCVNNPEHNFGMHPEDYILYNVGAWSPNTGHLTCPSTPTVITSGIDILQKEQKT